jgi:lipopolysaccharide export system permease protein
MIKFNELVSFYSLGYTVKKLIKPFFFFAFSVFLLFIALESGKFAYVREYADSILNKKQFSNTNLFIKHGNKIIYMRKLTPLLKQAEGLKIFYFKNLKVVKIITSDKAYFRENVWFVKNAEIKYINSKNIIISHGDLYVLKNFKPKIISNLKNLNSISLYDAFIAIKLFKDVNINMLLSIVFFKIFTALCMLFLLIIIMFKTPIHQRISNVSLFLVKSVLFTILVWGIQLMIYKFAKQGVLSPYALIVPFGFMGLYSLFLIYKEK